MEPVDRRNFIKSVAATSAFASLEGRAGSAPNPGPVFLSTWVWGKSANERAAEVFKRDGSLLDAVEKGINVPENDPLLARVRRLHLRQRRVAVRHAEKFSRFFQRDVLLEIVIHHRDRRAAAARETLDELHRETPIRRNRDRIAVPRIVRMPVHHRALLLLLKFREINPRRSRHILPQLIRTGERA